jgi:hypothetical protein
LPAMCVHETQGGAVALARSPFDGNRLLAERSAGHLEPLFPLIGALWLVVGSEQEALCSWGTGPAAPSSGAGRRPRAQGCAGAAWPSTRPGRGRRATPSLYQVVAGDRGPGVLGEIGAAFSVTEDPAVTPGFVERAEVPVDNPAPRLVRVAVPGPLERERPHMRAQLGEGPAGHHRPVVGRPAPDNGAQPCYQCWGIRPSDGTYLGAEPFPVPLQGSFDGLTSSFPLWRRTLKPRKSQPWSRWTTRVLSSLKASPRGASQVLQLQCVWPSGLECWVRWSI